MKPILTTRKIDIPNGIDIQTKSRKIIVSGKIGCIINYYKHILVDIKKRKKRK